MRRSCVSAFVILSLMLATSWSRADQDAGQKETAKVLFQQAVRFFKEGRYEEAVQSFREADRMSPTWKMYFNIGQCEAALKRYGLAIESFEHYLAHGGDDVPVERRDEVIKELERLRTLVGTVEVKYEHGIEVQIDGVSRGTTPLVAGIRVTAGMEHEVRLIREGEELFVQRLTLGGGQVFSLEPDSPKQPEQVPPPLTEPALVEKTITQEPVDEPVVEEQPIDEDSGLSPAFFWVGLSATAAFGAVTVAMSLAAESKWDEANKNPEDKSIRDDGKVMQVAGLTFLGLTGAAAVTTAVLAGLTDFKNKESASQANLSVGLSTSSNGGGILLLGEF